MINNNFSYLNKKINILDLSLFCLSFFQFMSNITVISSLEIFLYIKNFIEILCYFLLIFVIFQRNYSTNKLIVIVFISILLTYGRFKSGMSAFVFAWLLIVASKGQKYEHLINILYKSMLITFIIALFCYMGTTNLYTLSQEVKSGITFCLGQKNQAGLFLAYMYLMKKTLDNKNEKIYLDLIYALCVYIITRSKTAAVVIMLYPFLKNIFKIALVKRKKWIFSMAKLIVPFLFLFNYFCAKNFLVNGFSQFVDKIMTNRVFLNWFILSKNTLTFWGQNIQLRYTGVHNPVRNTWNITTTVDSAYMLALLVMGIIPTILFIVGYIKTIEIAYRFQKIDVIVIAVIFALYGMSEVKTLSIYFNFVYLYLNCHHQINMVQQIEGS